tara:strand:- start:151 stop:723 length:573 start_codon:yes stop_codon:yes gene_type:complete
MRNIVCLILLSLTIGRPFNSWLISNEDFIISKYKLIAFNIKQKSLFDLNEDFNLNGKLYLGIGNKFRFELGKRIVLSDGEIWKSYNKEISQIFLYLPDKNLEKYISFLMDINKVKSIPLKQEANNIESVQFLEDNNEIKLFFNKDARQIDSIEIYDPSYSKIVIYNIHKSIIDSINLNIELKDYEVFDLR